MGRVTDATSEAIAAAEVTLVDEETNRVRTSKTDSNGEFAATLLPAGAYRIEVTAAGYLKFTVTLFLGVDNSNTGIASVVSVVDRPNVVGDPNLSNPDPLPGSIPARS